MADMCPHCGFNLKPDLAIVAGDWHLTASSTHLRGDRLDLTPQQSAVLYTIAKGRGAVVSAEVIMNRVSSSDSVNIVHVLLSRLRRRLRVIPFRTERGHGFRWTGESQ